MSSEAKEHAECKSPPPDVVYKAGGRTITAQLRGETIAYAAQSGLFSIGANVFEPYIGYRVQRYVSDHQKSHPGYGSYAQNLVGEFAGDLIGCGSLILAETFIPEQLHNCTRKLRMMIDPVYDKLAKKAFAKELERGNPDCKQNMEEWKVFHERNLVRSGMMAVTGIAGNVATQKLLLRNPASTTVIFAGKLASTAVTTGLGLTARMALPKQTKALDSWMSKKIFAPMLEDKFVANEPGEGAPPEQQLPNTTVNYAVAAPKNWQALQPKMDAAYTQKLVHKALTTPALAR